MSVNNLIGIGFWRPRVLDSDLPKFFYPALVLDKKTAGGTENKNLELPRCSSCTSCKFTTWVTPATQATVRVGEGVPVLLMSLEIAKPEGGFVPLGQLKVLHPSKSESFPFATRQLRFTHEHFNISELEIDFDGDFLPVENVHLLFPAEDEPASAHSIRFRHVNFNCVSVAMKSLSNLKSETDFIKVKSASAPASLWGKVSRWQLMQSPDPKN